MPLRNQIHIDQLLSNVAVKYRNEQYIAEEIAPRLPVRKDSDLFRVYDRNFRIPETSRANKGLANEHTFEVSSASYVLQNHALKDYVSEEDAANYDMSDLRADVVEELSDKIMMRQELMTAQLFTTTSWSLNVSLAAANAFTADTTVSNPILVFDTGATEIIGNSGIRPNTALIPRTGYIGAKNHQSVLDRIKYTSSEVSENMMAQLFGVDRLLVPASQYDTSNKGVTANMTDIWGDSAWIGYVQKGASPRRVSSLYTLQRDVPMVRRWRDEERDAEAIEVQKKLLPRVVASLTGFLIKDVY